MPNKRALSWNWVTLFLIWHNSWSSFGVRQLHFLDSQFVIMFISCKIAFPGCPIYKHIYFRLESGPSEFFEPSTAEAHIHEFTSKSFLCSCLKRSGGKSRNHKKETFRRFTTYGVLRKRVFSVSSPLIRVQRAL